MSAVMMRYIGSGFWLNHYFILRNDLAKRVANGRPADNQEFSLLLLPVIPAFAGMPLTNDQIIRGCYIPCVA